MGREDHICVFISYFFFKVESQHLTLSYVVLPCERLSKRQSKRKRQVKWHEGSALLKSKIIV